MNRPDLFTSFTPRLGAVVTDTGVTFRVWAPLHREVQLLIEGREAVRLQSEGDEGYFAAHVEDARAGQRYWYVLGGDRRPDPASRYQPEGPFGPSEVVDPRAYTWRATSWKGAPPSHRHVIYEMHIGTFTPEGTWAAAEEHLVFLAETGITTLEIMPIADFPGRFGWGYDGVNLYAPTQLYGTPDDLRHFIDAAHETGLSVILDVVYNHLGPDGNFLPQFSATYFGAPGEWGDTINYDGPGSGPVRAYMAENAAYWIHEYRFDGLRLDATQGIVDRSGEHVISEICRAARAAAGARRIFLVGESEPQDTTLLEIFGKYPGGLDAIWNEDWHHSAYVALTGRRFAYFTDYLGTGSEFASMARHGPTYQGQWYSWQTKPRGAPSLGLPGASYVSYLENHDQVANTGIGTRLFEHADKASWRTLTALLLLGPSIPMLFQGQESLLLQPFVYFADHQGDLGAAVERGRFEFLRQFPGLTHPDVRQFLKAPNDEGAFAACKLNHGARQEWAIALHRDLLQLRRDDAVLSMIGTRHVQVESSAPAERVALIRYISSDGERLLVVNLGDNHLSAMNDPLLAPPRGTRWELLWSSEHPRYAGTAAAPFVEAGRWLVTGRTAAVLKPGAAT